ncbi:MAG: sodium-dependent transporter [Clostridia bacterium]|nr:sodium-dependent transporter [Clostridia bacterium]MDY2929230.1 sodium-dependent transporter [Clostridiaceae bacterium]
MKETTKPRDSFATKWGFRLACIGSAVGMGNIWLFPYRLGQLGGAAFLIPYILWVVLLGQTGLVGEMTLGRSMKSGPLGAFGKTTALRGKGKKLGEGIAVVPVLGGLALAMGYSVVVGWILKYLWGSITGSVLASESIGAYFGGTASSFGSVGWHLLGLAITFAVMLFGIQGGIEKMNKVMIPLFYALFLVLAVRVFTLGNASAGYRYLFVPDWSALLQVKTWVYALGQAFFSLSLAGTGTVVYGSYLREDQDIPASARTIALFDTLAALLAALVIIPAVFAYGLDPASGPPLMFITMPTVFQQMPGGSVFMIVFFVAVLLAALTSLVNLFETPIEALQTYFGLGRKPAVGIVAAVSAAVGVCIEGIVSSWMDVCSIYLCPLGALMAAVMLFWVCGSKYAREHAQRGAARPLGKWFEPAGKYVFCGVTLLVLVLGILYGGIG